MKSKRDQSSIDGLGPKASLLNSAGLVQTQISVSVHVNPLLIRAPHRSMIGLTQKTLRICGSYHSHLITSSLSCVLSTIISKVINMGDVSWMMPVWHCIRNHTPFVCWQSEWRDVLFLRRVTSQGVWQRLKNKTKKKNHFYYWSSSSMGLTRQPLYLRSCPSSTRALWFTRCYPARYLTVSSLLCDR